MVWLLIILGLPATVFATILLVLSIAWFKELTKDLTFPNIYGDDLGNKPAQTYTPTIIEKVQDKVKTVYYNTPDPKVPPRATFFCKLDGDNHTTTGDYEEKYLSINDLYHWNKARKKEGEPISLTAKSTNLEENLPLSEQNGEKTVDLAKI